MSDIPDTNDINKLAAWFDKDTLELIGHILNKHTKACLSQMKELVIERKELKKRLAEAESEVKRLKSAISGCTFCHGSYVHKGGE